jgi:hypothetical protein
MTLKFEIVITGPPYIFYYKHGIPHRNNGPAIIWSEGDQFWFYNGKRHRTNGPAIIWVDGDKLYFKHGKQL